MHIQGADAQLAVGAVKQQDRLQMLALMRGQCHRGVQLRVLAEALLGAALGFVHPGHIGQLGDSGRVQHAD